MSSAFSSVLTSGSSERDAATDHELRTALAMIVGYAELLRTRDDPELWREAPERILAAAERLSATIDRLAEAEPSTEERPPEVARIVDSPAAPRGTDFRIAVAGGDDAVLQQLRAALPSESFALVPAETVAPADDPHLLVVDWADVTDAGPGLVTAFQARAPSTPVLVVLSGEGEGFPRPPAVDAVLTRPVTNLHLLAKVYELVSPPTARAAAG